LGALHFQINPLLNSFLCNGLKWARPHGHLARQWSQHKQRLQPIRADLLVNVH
jgi:hypothetical protein